MTLLMRRHTERIQSNQATARMAMVPRCTRHHRYMSVRLPILDLASITVAGGTVAMDIEERIEAMAPEMDSMAGARLSHRRGSLSI
jgi:hypothetical protein